jgi:hypothetical protein
MLHPSILPEYHDSVVAIQDELVNSEGPISITQSIVELWKFIYTEQPTVVEAKIPKYPDYRRELVAPIIVVSASVDWSLVDQFDLEYYRVIEHFASRSKGSQGIIIDLSFYDANEGTYWADLDPSAVIKMV